MDQEEQNKCLQCGMLNSCDCTCEKCGGPEHKTNNEACQATPKPELIARPVYYNKLSMFLCDRNDKPIMEIIEDNDEVGQFIADAINKV